MSEPTIATEPPKRTGRLANLRPPLDKPWAVIRSRAETGTPLVDLAREYDIKPDTLRKHAKYQNWVLPSAKDESVRPTLRQKLRKLVAATPDAPPRLSVMGVQKHATSLRMVSEVAKIVEGWTDGPDRMVQVNMLIQSHGLGGGCGALPEPAPLEIETETQS